MNGTARVGRFRLKMPAFGQRGAKQEDLLFALFLWNALLLLNTLGLVSRLDLTSFGLLLGLGSAILLMTSMLSFAFKDERRDYGLLVFIIYSALITLPAGIVALQNTERIILLDLYFILLVTTPAFLRLWSWPLQGLATALSLIAVSIIWLPRWGVEAFPSFILVLLAGALALALLVVKSPNAPTGPGDAARQVYSEIERKLLKEHYGSIIFAEVALVLILLVADLASGLIISGSQIRLKIYSLIALVLVGLLLNLKQERTLQLVSISVLLVASVASLSAVSYQPQSLASILPLSACLCFVFALPVPFTAKIMLTWLMLLLDLALRAGAAAFAAKAPVLQQLHFLLNHEQLNLAVIMVVALTAIIAARTLSISRINRLGEYRKQQRQGRTFPTVSEMPKVETDRRFVPTALDEVAAEAKGIALAATLVSGVISCFASSRLVLVLGSSSWVAAAATWFVCMLAWGLLFVIRERPASDSLFWLWAGAISVVLLVWPSALLLIADHPGALWLFWPSWVLVTIALVPWPLKYLTGITLIGACIAVQLVRSFELPVSASILLFVFGVFSLLLSVQSSRAIRERTLVFSLSPRLTKCTELHDVAALLADYLSFLYSSPIALICFKDHVEVLQNGELHMLSASPISLNELSPVPGANKFHDAENSIVVLNNIPSNVVLLDRRFGLFRPTTGLLFQLRPGEGIERDTDVAIFVPTSYPLLLFQRLMNSKAAVALLEGAQLKLAALKAEHFCRTVQSDYEVKFQEREQDLNALVHDINNTVQDLTLVCDTIVEDVIPAALLQKEKRAADDEVAEQIYKVSTLARSVAATVSDAKRRRELEKLPDLSPREMVEVVGVVKEMASFAALRAARKQIIVRRPVLPPPELWVKVSVREHLEAILRNLLNNAISYSDSGAEIRVELKYDDQWVHVLVSDDGRGLTEEEITKAFLPGYRGRSAVGAPSGLGVGLAESRRIAESAGGKLEAYSAGEGRGASFTVSLPRRRREAVGTEAQGWALLVDDQVALTEVYSRLAKALELIPRVASSVNDAADIVEKFGRPHLVVTDIHLPDESGLELVRRLRQQFGQALPIMVVSGLAHEDIAQQARDAGATDFLRKPVSRRALFARIQGILATY